MTADGAIYRSGRMAAAYAFSRLPVHVEIVASQLEVDALTG